jgi:hypothetical protein
VTAGRLRQLVLGAAPFLENARELLVAALALELRPRPALRDFREAALHALELGGRDARPAALDLSQELLRPLRRGRLQSERTQPFAHLVLEITGAIHLNGDAGELQLRAMAALLEAAEPGGLLDERTALSRFRAENLFHPPLSNDRMELGAEPDLRQELDDVDSPDAGAVDQVLTLAASVETSSDGKLGELDRPIAVLVVEEELHLGERSGCAARPAGVKDIVGLLGPQLARAQAAGGPDDRVGDVRLAGAVGADDDGHTRLEANLDGIRERLEAAQANGAQVHAAGV